MTPDELSAIRARAERVKARADAPGLPWLRGYEVPDVLADVGALLDIVERQAAELDEIGRRHRDDIDNRMRHAEQVVKSLEMQNKRLVDVVSGRIALQDPPPIYVNDPSGIIDRLTMERDQARDIATRLLKKGYVPWANAGGAQECKHRVALFFGCRECDADTINSWDAETPQGAAPGKER